MSVRYWDATAEEYVATEGESGNLKIISKSEESQAVCKSNYYTFSVKYNAANDEHVIYVENTSSTENLFITDVFISGKKKSVFHFQKADGSGTGTDDVTEVNWDSSSADTADVNSKRNASVTGEVDILYLRIIDHGSQHFKIDHYMVAENEAVAVLVESGDELEVTLAGYFE